MAVKMVIVVLILTYFLDSRLREPDAGKEPRKKEQAAKADSVQTDSFFDTAVFADRMQSTVFLIRQ